MSVKFDVNACLEAAMRANPNASREFLTRALSQTLTNAGQETSQEDVSGIFDEARRKVSWAYMGAPMPLQNNYAARLHQSKQPTQTETEDEGEDETVEETSAEAMVISEDYVAADNFVTEFGESVYGSLPGDGGTTPMIESIARVVPEDGKDYAERAHSVTVRLYFNEGGVVDQTEVMEGEEGAEEAVTDALNYAILPTESLDDEDLAAGYVDVQVDFVQPVVPEDEA